MASIKGKTETGFDYCIDTECLDDFYLLEDIGRAQSGDLMALSSVLTRMLGEEQKKALLKHCEDENGRAKVSRVGDEVAAIFSVAKQERNAKNS